MNFILPVSLSTEMPFGKVPILEVDGRSLPQSKAIAAYIAREFGMCRMCLYATLLIFIFVYGDCQRLTAGATAIVHWIFEQK